MAENSKIEWTDHTFNPWVGCTKISPACDHCYAESWAKRTGSPGLWRGERRRTTASNWLQPVKWNRDAAMTGVHRKVFCASLADVFDNQVPASWRDDLWRLVERTPHLDWLLLTKRPQNIAKMLPDPLAGVRAWGNSWPNVWLGTTAEDRKRAASNLAALCAIPAAVRFVSAEPLLEDWSDMLPLPPHGPAIHWLICGGESGGRARDMPEEWAAAFRDRCAAAGTRFFMKQMARKAPSLAACWCASSRWPPDSPCIPSVALSRVGRRGGPIPKPPRPSRSMAASSGMTGPQGRTARC